MKPAPPPDVPGATEAERMDYAARALMSTPKAAFTKSEEESKAKRPREHKKHPKPHAA